MNRFVSIILISFCCLAAIAQPPARKNQQTQQQQKSQAANAGNLTGAAYRDFPTAQTMPEDAAWRRDIYRSLDLKKESNATLYYPVEPTQGRQSLFNFLFRSILRGQIKAYEYTIDAVEHLDDKHIVRGKTLMDNYQVYYESNDGKIRVNDADIASLGVDVTMYYIKESVYYDQHTASFRSKVTAICPVRVNDFGGGDALRTPLFWVNYEEAAPLLAKLMLSSSSYNNAAMISADDFFTLNQYDGEIYKTSNLQDKLLSELAETPEQQKAEQRKIEGQLTDFQNHVWGHDSITEDVDSAIVDSAAVENKVEVKKTKTTSRRGGVSKKENTSKKSSATKPKKEKVAKPKASGNAGLSVRRQRH